MRRAPLELDFVVPPRRARAAGAVVLVLAIVVTGILVDKYMDAHRRLQQLTAADALLRTAPAPRLASRERLDEQVRSAQATVRQLALPWADLIDALERSSMREVSVLHIQPDAQQRLMRVTAEARGERQMLEYLRRMSQTGGFAEVHLVNHQLREDDPLRPIQFSLQASFRETR